MKTEQKIIPLSDGDTGGGTSPKGFLQWLIWFNNHFNLMCLVVLYIFALIPIFYLPEHKTSTCLIAGIYFGVWIAFTTKEHKKDKLERKIENILLIPLLLISAGFLITWLIIHKYPPDFLPNWAMGLVVIVGGFFWYSHYYPNKRP